MRKPFLAAAGAAATVWMLTSPAGAQDGGYALGHFEPTPPGDVFFGVAGPAAPGHLEVRGQAMFDYAQRPIRLRNGDASLVSKQGFLRLDASLALWERLLVSVGFPFAVVLDGDDPGLTGWTFTPLEAPQAGDLRIGLRGRIWGEDAGPFQVGGGGYLFLPTGSQDQYAGDGTVRGTPHLSLGGRVGATDFAFLYSATVGAQLRAGAAPMALAYGAGAGVVFLDDLIQVGAEASAATFLGDSIELSSTPVFEEDAGTNAELLFGAKLRVLGGLTFGAGAGPGLGTSVGTPVFRAVGFVGWSPFPAPAREDDGPKEAGDQDDDGINDDIDACPEVAGEPNADPTKDGCPLDDRDKDGILDVEDACPTTPGLRNVDATHNGCPRDSDDDGVHDGIDRCPQIPGEMSEVPEKNGCPPDRDDDGIIDKMDACPADKGAKNEEPKRNGCPEDPDGDGIRWGDDACPLAKGDKDPDPRRNGCPRHGAGPAIPVDEEVGYHVLFRVSKWTIDDVNTPLKKSLADDIRKILADPEVRHVEVQGHTDDSGEDEINDQVGLKRAHTIRDWLLGHGLPGDRLIAKGFSYLRPVADNRIRKGRMQNRRVQFVVIRK